MCVGQDDMSRRVVIISSAETSSSGDFVGLVAHNAVSDSALRAGTAVCLSVSLCCCSPVHSMLFHCKFAVVIVSVCDFCLLLATVPCGLELTMGFLCKCGLS